MKQKRSNIVFILLFMAILLLPVVFMNTKTNQISRIDNKNLTEWPGLSWKLSTKDAMEAYINDRIGFREDAIETYIELNDKLFHVMVHPLFMYGQEGHIFFKDPAYISAYQRLNTDPEFLDSMVTFLQQTQDYLDSKDIKFIYYLCPDKKTIYSEYFPKEIHVQTENESVIEHVEASLEKTDVNSIIPVDELLAAKQEKVVYNKMYDATHWNEFGAFLGHKLIDDKVQEWFDDVPPLTEDDYNLTFEKRDTLDVAEFPIDEEVPVYTLKNDTSGDATYVLEPSLDCPNKNFFSHHVNPEAPNDRIVLVFTDSYFAGYTDFYTNRFKEVYFVHRQNFDCLQYLVNLTFPNLVIFETAERSITGEMQGVNDFTDYYYEEPYPCEHANIGEGIFSPDAPVDYTLTMTSGIRADGTTLYLDPDGGEGIVKVSGILNQTDSSGEYDVYAHVSDSYLETESCALYRQAKEEGLKEFSFSVQRRYLSQGPIELIAVDHVTKEAYLLDTFEVVYGK